MATSAGPTRSVAANSATCEASPLPPPGLSPSRSKARGQFCPRLGEMGIVSCLPSLGPWICKGASDRGTGASLPLSLLFKRLKEFNYGIKVLTSSEVGVPPLTEQRLSASSPYPPPCARAKGAQKGGGGGSAKAIQRPSASSSIQKR